MSNILKANITDIDEILDLQYLAFQTEADMLGTRNIPALNQQYDDVLRDFNNGLMLKMISSTGRIIGSVRAFANDDYVSIGKLMVHPDHRRKGYAAKLLREVEKYYPDKRHELYTCSRSLLNIALYESVGYKQYKTVPGPDNLDMTYLDKCC